MKIFADFHHSGLAYSLHLLAQRLGAELYFPIGEKWFDRGYWGIAKPYNNSPDTIKQYLGLDKYYVPKDGTVPLTDITDVKPTHYEIWDHAHGYSRKAITFDQFQEMDIDIIIPSIPDHYESYRKLRDIYMKRAKVVCQMGNMFNEVHDLMKDGIISNLLASTVEFATPEWVNTMFYHQEVNTSVFKLTSFFDLSNKITSFVNVLPRKELYEEYKSLLPEYEFKAYGASCPDGVVNTIEEMAQIMRESMFGYHVKPFGDGFGHVIYDWAFSGRPILTNFHDYKDKLAGELLEDGVTAIDVGRRSPSVVAEMIRKFSNKDQHIDMCLAMSKRVNERVNYDKETKKIKQFLENLR